MNNFGIVTSITFESHPQTLVYVSVCMIPLKYYSDIR